MYLRTNNYREMLISEQQVVNGKQRNTQGPNIIKYIRNRSYRLFTQKQPSKESTSIIILGRGVMKKL